jgi:hypothetical protein
MKKFLLIYHSPKEAMEKYSSMSEDDVKEVMDVWMKWQDVHGDTIVDFGNPVGAQHVVSTSGSRDESDDVTGYAIIQAENIEEAKKVLENHPSLIDDDGSTVSLYQVNEM